MVKRILLSLVCIVVLLLSACQLPASTSVPTESSTSASSETGNIPAPTLTLAPENTPLSTLDMSKEQATALDALVSDALLYVKSWDLIMPPDDQPPGFYNYEDLSQLLMGAYLVEESLPAGSQQPTAREWVLSHAHGDQNKSVKNFFDAADALQEPARTKAINSAIQTLGLANGAPDTSFFKPTYTPPSSGYTFDPTDPNYLTNLTIQVLNNDAHPFPDPFYDETNPSTPKQITAHVHGVIFDPANFQLKPFDYDTPITTSDISQYDVKLRVPGAVDWAIVTLWDQQNHVVGYFLATNRPLGISHLMAMRSLPLANPYESILPSWVYNTPDPVSLPAIPQEQLETVMKKNLESALQKAVAFGDINQDTSDTLLNEFNDPQLIAVVKDPALRAAVLLSASNKSAGGDLILPILLRQDDHNTPVRMFFEDDPEFEAMLNGTNGPPSIPGGALVGYLENGTTIIIWDKAGKDGQEPIEALAALMPHEVIVHDAIQISMAEETVADLMQAVAWAHLVQRDPSLVTKNTSITRNNNLLLYVLLNSVYVDEEATSPLKSHVGLITRITGVQTHNQADYNAWPNSSTRQIKNFYELVQRLNDKPISPMTPVSSGSDTTLQLFKILFGTDVVIPRQLGHSGPNGETIPDFSELLLTDFIDQRVQQLIPDETFKELAQALHVTLDGSNETP